ncbi:hypothetical protein V6L77_24245 [Pannonibacter sp. Pt2-lr]
MAFFRDVQEQTGHQPHAFFHHRQQHVLVGAVLAAFGVGVGHPDGGQTEDFGEGVVGQGSGKVRQNMWLPAGRFRQRLLHKFDPRMIRRETGGAEAFAA